MLIFKLYVPRTFISNNKNQPQDYKFEGDWSELLQWKQFSIFKMETGFDLESKSQDLDKDSFVSPFQNPIPAMQMGLVFCKLYAPILLF